MISEPVRITVSKLVDHQLRQSSSALLQLPSLLNKDDSADDSSQFSLDGTQNNLTMDRLFFDPFCNKDKCVVEHFVRKRDENTDEIWTSQGYISIAKESCVDSMCSFICDYPTAVEGLFGVDAIYRCGANSAVAHIQLESLSNLLKHCATEQISEKLRGFSNVATLAKSREDMLEYDGSGERAFLCTTPVYTRLLFEEEEISKMPETGSVVPLIGKAAFPCVCEVSEKSDSLFQDKGRCVVAEGVKWQSLYLVVLEKHMVLAEPATGDSGGNGRIVTLCQLSNLIVDKDSPGDVENTTPARRLLLTHFSPTIKPPGVFIIDQKEVNDRREAINPVRDEVSITRCSMDIWFEDFASAEQALKALSHKIAKARSKRGHKIREYLISTS